MGEPMAILLVDDEPKLRETLARALTAHGYLVEQAGSHREAVAAALARDHRLMVLDVNLPDATGWDVFSRPRRGGQVAAGRSCFRRFLRPPPGSGNSDPSACSINPFPSNRCCVWRERRKTMTSGWCS